MPSSASRPSSLSRVALAPSGSGFLVSISGATAVGAAGSSVSVRRSRARAGGLGRVAGLRVVWGAAVFLARVVFLVRFADTRLLPRLRTAAAFLDRRERLGAALAIAGPAVRY